MELSQRTVLSCLRSSIEEGNGLPLEEPDGDSSTGTPKATHMSRWISTCRINLWSAALNFGSNRRHWKKFTTSPCAIVELLLDMLGRADKIGFSMFSWKLADLSNKAAVYDPRCTYNFLSGLPEDMSNLLDAAIAPVSTHPLPYNPSKPSGAWQYCSTIAHQ